MGPRDGTPSCSHRDATGVEPPRPAVRVLRCTQRVLVHDPPGSGSPAPAPAGRNEHGRLVPRCDAGRVQPFFDFDGNAYHPSPVTRSPWSPETLHGGAPGALLVGAIERHQGTG